MILKKYIIFVFTLLFFSCLNKSYSQYTKIDSLKNQIIQSSNSEVKIENLKLLFTELVYKNTIEALYTAQQIYDLSELDSNKQNTLTALNLKGIAFMELGKYDSSFNCFQNAINFSILYKDSVLLSKSYNNFGILHANMGKYDKSSNYINKSAEIDYLLGDLDGSLITYLNLSSLFLMLDKPDTAKSYLMKCEKFIDKVKDEATVATYYSNLGSIETELSNFEEAIKYYTESIKIAKTIDYLSMIAHSFRGLAAVYQKQKNYKAAVEHDIVGLNYALLTNNAEQIAKTYKGLSNSYENMQNYNEALKYHKMHSSWKDSVIVRENRLVLIEMEEKFNTAQTQKENQILIHKNNIQDLEIEQKKADLKFSKTIIFSSIAGLFLLIILAFALYNRNVIRQKANFELKQVNDKLQTAYSIISEKNADITASIEYASKIQQALYPENEGKDIFKDSFFMLLPKDIVSGDFYWYGEQDGKLIVSAADCTGHGVPGALMSMLGNTFLNQIINERGITQTNEILDILRKKVVHTLSKKSLTSNRRDGMDISICAINLAEKKIQYSGAYNPVYVMRKNEIIELRADKQPVGYMPEKDFPFNYQEVEFEYDDILYMFSDGFADQFGGELGKKYKYKNFKEFLVKISHLPMQEQKKELLREFHDWKGDYEQLDDVCIIGVRL